MNWRRLRAWQWQWLWVLLPLGVALLVMAGIRYGGNNPRIRLTLGATLADWVLAVGVVFTVLTTMGGVIGLWRDRRGDRRLHAQQRSWLAERRRFLQRLDHELKNPLTAMRAALANLSATTNDPARSAIESIDTQTLRMSRLTTDLRKLAELETRPLERNPVNLSLLLREAVDLAQEQPDNDARTITLTLPQAPWPLPPITGDWDLLFLAVFNLLDNALKFTRAHDAIEVRAREEGAHIIIEVADTGPGIPPEEAQHVWEDLYRGKQSTHTAGSGLGLALVKAIIERHGGLAMLTSRVGQGTVFTLRLPL
jgi:two-component system OmpR family sensor kinase